MAKARKVSGRAKSKRPHARPAAGPSRKAAALRVFIEAMPGAAPGLLKMRGNPVAVLHKLCGKMFAIQSLRGEEYVILKCDPDLMQALKREYQGIGHRSHLDRRFWMAVELNADVPMQEVRRLVDHSYGLVRASLTRKQQAQFEGK